MFQALRKMFVARDEGPLPEVPAGQRIYAVGDVHGRLDLFEPLVRAASQPSSTARKVRPASFDVGDLMSGWR